MVVETGLVKATSSEDSEEVKAQLEAENKPLKYFEESEEQYSKKLKLLEEIAWEAQVSDLHSLCISGVNIIGYLKREYKISEYDDIRQKKVIKSIRKLGLLESQYNERNKRVSENNYYFPHLTFQEYFAAKYWVRMYCSEKAEIKMQAEELFKQYKYFPRFEVVWWFVAGIISEVSKKNLRYFLNLINEEPRELVGLNNVAFLIRCIEESQDFLENNNLLDDLIDKIITWIDWSIRNSKDKINARVLYQALNQSPKVYSHSKIVTYFENILTYNIDLDSDMVLKTILFFREVPPTTLRVIMLFSDAFQKQKEKSGIEISELSIDTKSKYGSTIIGVNNCKISIGQSFVKWATLSLVLQIPADRFPNDEHFIKYIMNGFSLSFIEEFLSNNKDLSVLNMFSKQFQQVQTQIQTVTKFVLNTQKMSIFNKLLAVKSLSYLFRLSGLSIQKMYESFISLLRDEEWLVRLNTVMEFPDLPWEKFDIEQRKSLIKNYIYSLEDKDNNVQVSAFTVLPRLLDQLFETQVQIVFQNCITKLEDEKNIIRSIIIDIILQFPKKYLSTTFRKQLYERYIVGLLEDTVLLENNTLLQLAWEHFPDKLKSHLYEIYISRLKSYDFDVRMAAVKVLHKLPWEMFTKIQVEELYENYTERLSDINENVRIAALQILPYLWERFFDEQQQQLYKRIIECLSDELWEVRRHALEVLSKFLGTHSIKMQTEFICNSCFSCLKDQHESVRKTAIGILKILSWWKFFDEQDSPNIDNIQEYICNFVRCAYFTESSVYLDLHKKHIHIISEGSLNIIQNVVLYQGVLKWLEFVRAECNLPRNFEDSPKVSRKSIQLSNSPDRFLSQKENPLDYVFNIKSCEFRLILQIISKNKIKIYLKSDNISNSDRLISVRNFLSAFLKEQLEDYDHDIYSAGEACLEVIGNEAALMRVIQNLHVWLQYDFPEYYSTNEDELGLGCSIC